MNTFGSDAAKKTIGLVVSGHGDLRIDPASTIREMRTLIHTGLRRV